MKRNTIARTFTMAAVAALTLGLASTANADDKGCTNATLKGTFGFTSTGAITAPPALAGPFAEVGTQTFDGKGGTTATATLSANGNIIPVTVTGTYTINSDCTGTSTILVSPFNSTVHLFFVIDDGVNEIRAIETETGYVISRVYRRQFPVGDIRN